MNSKSRLLRTSDQKVFHVARLGHWSEIVSEDGEEDYVKWYGVHQNGLEAYVSNNLGHDYELLPDMEEK